MDPVVLFCLLRDAAFIPSLPGEKSEKLIVLTFFTQLTGVSLLTSSKEGLSNRLDARTEEGKKKKRYRKRQIDKNFAMSLG